MTAVSPMSGWPSRREMSVVLPLPRKPVTRDTGVLANGRQELVVERIERRSRELLRLAPDRAEVLDDRRPSRPVAEDIDPAGPLVEPQAVVGEHAVQQAEPERPSPPVTALLRPAFVEEDTAEAAHLQSVLPADREERTWPR